MLTVTFVASEALAVTVMPVVARDLGGVRPYGWALSGFMLGSVIGIGVGGAAVAAAASSDLRLGITAAFAAAAAVALIALALTGRLPPGTS